MDFEDARTVGARLRRIRHVRRKSLVVVAGLAGISKSHLSRIERGEVALDSRSETVALANALGVSPSELIRLPVPAPGNGGNDVALVAVRSALMAVSRNQPGGQVPLRCVHRPKATTWALPLAVLNAGRAHLLLLRSLDKYHRGC